MSSDVPIRALVAVCRAVGRRVPMWTQGIGGNVSIKAGDGDPVLWIKASGMRLDQVGGDGGLEGVACVRLAAFATGAQRLARAADPEKAYAALLASCAVAPGRPSMETGFHAVLPGCWVLHLHSLAALLMVHEASRDEQRLAHWWHQASPLRHRVIRAEKPGWELMDRIRSLPSADVYLLENHGVILQATDGADALDQWQAIERRFLADWGYRPLLEWWDLPPEVLREKVDPAAPLRIFFPDTAVFLDRLKAVLVPAGSRGSEPLWQLAPHVWLEPRERDLAEIWLAQQLLLSACADLSELPEPIAAAVANLPLEQMRRGVRGQSG